MSLGDIRAPTSASRTAYLLRRFRRPAGAIVVCESAAETDSSYREASVQRNNYAADIAFSARGSTALRAAVATFPVRRYFRSHYGPQISTIVCFRCRNAARLRWNVTRPGEFQHIGSDERDPYWICAPCRNVDVQLALRPHLARLTCRTLRRLNLTTRRHPPRWGPYKRRRSVCRVVPVRRHPLVAF